MPEIRYFNEQGRIKWGEWLASVKESPALPFPDGLLTNPDLTGPAPGRAEYVPQVFSSKYELAKTLAPAIAQIRSARLPVHRWPGLWDWLAAAHFDSICPQTPGGQRKLKALPLYQLEQYWTREYRHRIFGPVGLFQRLGTASRILLHGPPSTLTDWEEQAAGRHPISSNAGIAEALFQLYWDPGKNAPKRGASPNEKKPGTLRRFSDLILQLDRTYDLLSIGPDGIIPLLPKEFDRFRRSQETQAR